MKTCPVGAELFRVDRWTDVMKLTVALHNFANTPKKYLTNISQACRRNTCQLYFLQTPLQTVKFIKYCGSEILNICVLHT